jgi:hypothetical protein
MRLQDSHRLRDTCETYDCPLRSISKKAKSMGWPVHYSGIYNLMPPPRKNATSSNCRSIVDARPAAPTRNESDWHARKEFSTQKVRYLEKFMEMLDKTKIAKTRSLYGDAMCTVPVWIPARHGGRLGFMIRLFDDKGRKIPSVRVADHDFVLGARSTFSVAGWVRLQDLTGF